MNKKRMAEEDVARPSGRSRSRALEGEAGEMRHDVTIEHAALTKRRAASER